MSGLYTMVMIGPWAKQMYPVAKNQDTSLKQEQAANPPSDPEHCFTS